MERGCPLHGRRRYLVVSLWSRLGHGLLLALLTVSLAYTDASAGAGDVLWEDKLDLGRDTTAAGGLVASQGTLFALGVGPNTSSPCGRADILVRAYRPKTGDLRWYSRWNPSGCTDVAAGIVAAAERVVVAGTGNAHRAPPGPLVVRGYDANTGDVAWEDRCFADFSHAAFASGVATDADRVFVAGVCNRSAFLRAYDAGTGAVLWDGSETTAGMVLLAADGGRLFGVGFTNLNTLLIRAYDAATGTLSWEVRPDAAFDRAHVSPSLLLTAGGGAVFAHWNSGTGDHRIQAYDADTGTLLWQDDPGGAVEFVMAQGRLFAGGFSNLRAYDARSGEVRWEDPRPVAPRAVGGNQVIGRDNSVPGAVRVYDAASGEAVWEVKPGSGETFGSMAWEAARIFVGGVAVTQFGVGEFLLRAYDAK